MRFVNRSGNGTDQCGQLPYIVLLPEPADKQPEGRYGRKTNERQRIRIYPEPQRAGIGIERRVLHARKPRPAWEARAVNEVSNVGFNSIFKIFQAFYKAISTW